ncbi:LpqB family beta-propeller domain-containing protein [Amycolatopsis saalfeldensis]|uniref:Lipoprotein LpqB beta-propeller domain-containing protein n=1 Tax=Amycolatopsis saalfeldensis TaxID=394193 RepID=A0A1H8R0Z1_9PSEU|nr:LpqB family beta-propeller domain-containing protein [Amycolatopsis saalfeldensis]SEO60122.1 Lipoprotein LpqB beta-propeller domain-containing protein [Amycolatopsis saalfeldensis]
MKRALLALCCLLLLAGCANVPLESQPVVVSDDRPAPQGNDAPEPTPGIDALTLVRDFVRASGDPKSNNAAARAYLDDRQRSTWKPSRAMTIIDNIFGTNFDTQAAPPSTGPAPDPNVREVVLRGSVLGTMSADSAFIPGSGPTEQRVEVRKQADGQWRISTPPPALLVTDDDFDTNYNRVAVSFYSPDSGTFVPDLRYVAAAPQSGLPGRVMDLILQGPSAGLAGAVKNLLGDQVTLETNVKNNDDGSLLVPLSGLTGASPETRVLIAAQIVLSMQTVTSTRIRLLADGMPLVHDHEYWRSSDVPAYSAASSPNSGLTGLMTAGGRVRSLGDGAPVEGAAGNGAYNVVNAAQSIDGKRLAVVEHDGDQVRLRIGDMGRDLPLVDLTGGTLSRPTWRPAPAGAGPSGEVWTVVDRSTVARMVLDPTGHWLRQSVNANDVLALGQIDGLRLSRDGARVAAIVNGQLVVAAVIRSADTVTLREPRVLQPGTLSNVVDVDWGSTADSLVVVTSSSSQPVQRVSLDGRRMDAFNSSNLTTPVRAVTSAPSRPIVVADAGGLWNATELGEVWRPQPHSMPDAEPFYPG